MAVIELKGLSGFLIIVGLGASLVLTFVLASSAMRKTEGRIRSAPLVLAFCAVAANGIGQFLDESWILGSVLPLQAVSLATSVMLLVRQQRRSAQTQPTAATPGSPAHSSIRHIA